MALLWLPNARILVVLAEPLRSLVQRCNDRDQPRYRLVRPCGARRSERGREREIVCALTLVERRELEAGALQELHQLLVARGLAELAVCGVAVPL